MSKARDLANAGTALTTVSATELGYVDGVTSAIQTQIDSKIGSASAINPTIVDAKGDIITATAADTPARLAVGSNNTVLTADSAEATGLKWAAPSSGGMTLLSTTTLSGATTTISSIDQSYINLFIIVTNAVNNTADGRFRIGINGGTNSHDGVSTRFEQGGSAAISGFANDYLLTPTNLDRTNGTNTFAILMPSYSTSGVWKTFNLFGRYTSSTASTAISISGMRGDTSATTSLAFSNSGGNFSGGTVYIYGVK